MGDRGDDHAPNAEAKAVAEDFLTKVQGVKIQSTPVGLGGICLSAVSLIGFIAAAVFESHLPKPGNLFVFMGLMLAFVFGCYLAVPMLVTEDDQDGDEEELTGIRGLLASGWSWLGMGIIALVLVTVLYLM